MINKTYLHKITDTLRGQGGIRWFDKPTGTRYYVRISKGNPNAQWDCQKVDYVHVTNNGQVIGNSGNIIESAQLREAHIPLSEWLKWSQWWRP